MSRILASLLGVPEVDLTAQLASFEVISGRPGADVQLIAELSATAHRKMRELGLDPADTTARELYQALQSLVGQHDMFLASVLHIDDRQDVASVLPSVAQAVNHMSVAKECWAIKHSVLKKMLKKQAPKHVMKHLGYRSLDSMLKRESPAVLLAASRFAESTAWMNRFVKQYKSLQPSDFELREIEVAYLDTELWQKLAVPFVRNRRHNVVHLKEAGFVLILPLPVRRLRGLLVTMLPLVLHYVAEIRIYSALFKLEQVKPHFGSLVAKTILHDPEDAATIAGEKLHWRVLARHYGHHPNKHPDAFQPHVQPEDLYYQKAEELLYWLEPALKFWEELDYVLVEQPNGKQPISFSLLDNAINYCNHLELGSHVASRGKKSLWNEILLRYIGQPNIERAVIAQLSDDIIETKLVEAL